METVKSFASLLNNTSPVTIVANENVDGRPIVTPMFNPDQTPKTDLMGNPLGSIRLQQKTKSLNNGSFLNVRNRVAFIGGALDQLLALIAENKLVDGSILPGKIMVTESLAPFWPNQTGKINPQTEEPIGVTVGEKFYPVYLRMTYTENMDAKDTYIRTPEDVSAWMALRQTLAATSTVTAPETAGMPEVI